MVKFIVGKADLNISAAVRTELVSLLEKDENKQKIIFIVPDQFEYETEKALYRILESKKMLHRSYEINIKTFTRLCREILDGCDEYRQRPFADDIVKNIIMHKTLIDNKKYLSALRKIADRPGFCGRMVKTVSALKTSGITSRDLELSLKALDNSDKKLSPDLPIIKKLQETNTLYSTYESIMNEKYVDKLDVTTMAADNIEKPTCTVFEGASVFVDCFNDFTQSQLHFLECVIRRAANVTFGFTAQLKSDSDVFRTANNHIDRLKKAAEENGIDPEFVTDKFESRFSENSPLAGLSQHLFQTESKQGSLNDSCELVTSGGVYDELDYVAAKIKELTEEKGLRYNEIAVLCTDVGAYGKYVENTFKKYDIPLFLDTPEPILYQPLINLVSSILNALDDFSVDTVLSCVKTRFFQKPKDEPENVPKNENDDEPDEIDDIDSDENEEELTDIDETADKPDTNEKTDANGSGKKVKYVGLWDKDIDKFEKYIYEWDLKTSHLEEAFDFAKDPSDATQTTAEKIRQAVVIPLLELRASLQGPVNGAEITEKLFDFIIKKVGVHRAIKRRCKDINNKYDEKLVERYQRLWDTLVDIFNKLYTELKDTALTISDYNELFREICTSTTLAFTPQFIDCVLVGDIDRTRADNVKAAFIVGASYDAFPTPAMESGIFSQYEIELIQNRVIHIEDIAAKDANDKVAVYVEALKNISETNRRVYCLKNAKDQYYLSLYRAYRAITLPTEYLCISCPRNDVSGDKIVRSDIFGEIISTFRKTKVIDAGNFGNEFYCRTLKAAKLRYAMGLNGQSDENRVLRKMLGEDNEFVTALDEIRNIRNTDPLNNAENTSYKHSLDPKTAKLLFQPTISPTALEKLNLCKFNFFCNYGLNIEERSKRNFTSSNRGNAMHHVFECVFKLYSEDMNSFFKLTRSELLSLAKKYLAEYRDEETNNDGAEDPRTEYLFNNIANAAADVLITMQTELFARKYRPKFVELHTWEDLEDSSYNQQTIPNLNDTSATNPPEAELYSETETDPAAPNPAASNANAPYLITKPLTLPLDNGIEITVQGIIDRVDMFGAGKNEDGKTVAYVRVVDYKSSVRTFDIRNALQGINIQMLLYLFSLQSANEDNPTLELRPGGVSYVPSLNSGAQDELLSPYRLLAMNYHESGLFIRDGNTEEDLCNYQNIIFKKFDSDSTIRPNVLERIKSSYEPKDQNIADADRFNDLRRDVMKTVTDNLDKIFSGTVDALPTTYSEAGIDINGKEEKPTEKSPCNFCRFKDICHNDGKTENKVEKLDPRPAEGADPNTDYWDNKYINKAENEEDNVNGN